MLVINEKDISCFNHLIERNQTKTLLNLRNNSILMGIQFTKNDKQLKLAVYKLIARSSSKEARSFQLGSFHRL